MQLAINDRRRLPAINLLLIKLPRATAAAAADADRRGRLTRHRSYVRVATRACYSYQRNARSRKTKIGLNTHSQNKSNRCANFQFSRCKVKVIRRHNITYYRPKCLLANRALAGRPTRLGRLGLLHTRCGATDGK